MNTLLKQITATALCLAPTLSHANEEIRPSVFFAGEVEPEGTPRAQMQNLIFDVATAWADCNADSMTAAVSDDVQFSYPTTAYAGKDNILADLAAFCDSATDVSFYFPTDAFYIDEASGRIAAELQFRAFQRGNRQVVNDVWVATVEDGEITIIKEYLDGRVKSLQAIGVLEYEESPEFLTPWPSRTPEWEACFPLTSVTMADTCPPAE